MFIAIIVLMILTAASNGALIAETSLPWQIQNFGDWIFLASSIIITAYFVRRTSWLPEGAEKSFNGFLTGLLGLVFVIAAVLFFFFIPKVMSAIVAVVYAICLIIMAIDRLQQEPQPKPHKHAAA